ncbi:hypothetical protein VNO80_22987 [Phaseolus coccineus]|uniref:Uncharacterized protein n=1 Tax=Phaseolus coccineus TaxID=3886 RepID=A0AAN9M545_PHACN
MVQEAEELVRKMDKRNLAIDEFTQSALTRINLVLSQTNATTEMLGYAVEPDVIIYGVFINAFADAGSVKENWKTG